MKRRTARLAALTLCLALLLAGCWEEPVEESLWDEDLQPKETPTEDEGTSLLRFSELALPYLSGQTLDPVTCLDGAQQLVGALLYEPLFTLDEQFVPQKVLCSDYSYDAEQLTYTFTIRSDIYFSDGSELSAADVVATYNRAAVSERYAARFANIVSMRASGTYTLLIKLATPSNMLPALLDIPIIKSGSDRTLFPLGTGPYLYVSKGASGALIANTNWWQGEPALEHIALFSVKDTVTAAHLLSTYSIHYLIMDPTGSVYTPNAGEVSLTDIPTTTMQFIGFNTTKSLLSDKRVRSMMSGVIDRQNIVTTLLSGHGLAAQFPISPVSPLYPHSMERSTDRSSYTSLLSALGVNEEKPRTLTMLVNAENSFKLTVVEQLCAQLSTDALTIEPRVLPWSEYLEALSVGNFDLYFGEVRLTADWDSSALFGTLGTLNYGLFTDSIMDASLASFRASHGTAEVNNLIRYFQETAPIAPIAFKSDCAFTPTGLISGLTPTMSDPFSNMENWTFHFEASE